MDLEIWDVLEDTEIEVKIITSPISALHLGGCTLKFSPLFKPYSQDTSTLLSLDTAA